MLAALIAATLLAPLPVPTTADYQLGGAYETRAGIVARDWRDDPAPAAYGICYINAFQTQPEMLGWWQRHHPRLLLPAVDRAWDEVLLDTRQPRRLARITGRWIDTCARKGYDAVEPDNLDSWQRSGGLLTRRDNVRYSRLLIARAHRAGLAIAQKNAAGLAGQRLFDFAVVEECQRYRECGRFRRAYGRQVIEIEYRRRDFTAACRIRGDAIPVVLRDRLLRPAGSPGHVFASC